MVKADNQTGGNDKLLRNDLPTYVSLRLTEEPRSPTQRDEVIRRT